MEIPSPRHVNGKSSSVSDGSSVELEHHQWVRTLEGCLLQFSLSFLHLWNVDDELDNLLITEMKLKRLDSFSVSSGILGDRGSMTLTFPGSDLTLELWRSSSEYSALRSLTMVSLAQHLISLSHSCSSASSALAAFYTRKFAEKISDKPPQLQLLVSFWQNEFEHVKMAARSLFHCAASRAIPLPLSYSRANQLLNCDIHPSGISEKEYDNTTAVCPVSDGKMETEVDFVKEESEITSWLESYEEQDWISCVGATTQDAMTSQIIVAAALAVWYPSLVKPSLAMVTVHPLVKLVMAMNEKYSAAAAEILAEGMESTWKACIGSEIPRLIADIFFQVECVSSTSANASSQNSAPSLSIRETLVAILLPSLAMADVPGFLHVIESQIWSTASDSPVHVVSLMTLIRVVRGSPRNLAPYLEKALAFWCMAKARVWSFLFSKNVTWQGVDLQDFLVCLEEPWNGQYHCDICSKLLTRWRVHQADIRASMGGFSPNSTRSSIMASVLRDDGRGNSPRDNKALSETDRLKLLIHNLDLSYRLEWVGARKIKLLQHSHELGQQGRRPSLAPLTTPKSTFESLFLGIYQAAG
ncbi:hypothetical protein Sango_2261000 [Sesamum angolense]|uniref:Uncharacterized protein n=1 Tax=Sesamum angolense TaxID=2727404 RepID=A0AAE2BKZ5_9LAMI|nr:hypothetical protein Sango_2261000 [Sesamum angolense]